MNIFDVLSQGKSRLHEPSISAMMAYLFSPNEDHGLGDIVLREFLELIKSNIQNTDIIDKILKSKFIEADVDLEVQYVYKNKRNDIDIQISILDNDSKEILRIVVENKIRSTSANPIQLAEYYNAVINEEDFVLENPNLIFIFLTPKSMHGQLISEYNNLENEIKKHSKNNHACAWLYWFNDTNNNNSVMYIVKNILIKELNSEINPINEYMRHTLKAFIRYVSSIVIIKDEKKDRRGQDIGDIIEEAIIKTSDGKEHRIVRRDSTQIQIFNMENDEKEIARGLMAQYIDDNNIEINHKELNTRVIGRKLLDYLKNKSKN